MAPWYLLVMADQKMGFVVRSEWLSDLVNLEVIVASLRLGVK
jgi:hypothetical protein